MKTSDIKKLTDICWIASAMEDRQVGNRIETFVSSIGREVIDNASKK